MQAESKAHTQLLTVAQAASLLGVTEARLYELIRQRIVPSVSLGRQRKISASALQTFIDNGGQALPGGWRRRA